MFCLREGKPAILGLYGLFHLLQDISAAVFHDCRSAVWHSRKIITSAGACTFGIYLLHVVVKEYLSGLWRVFCHDWQMNKMLAALLFCAVVFVIELFL